MEHSALMLEMKDTQPSGYQVLCNACAPVLHLTGSVSFAQVALCYFLTTLWAGAKPQRQHGGSKWATWSLAW